MSRSIISPRMLPISPEALRLLQDKSPDFLRQVRAAQETAAHSKRQARVTLRLEAFEDDPFPLYACLCYAWTQGVEVRIPPTRMAGKATRSGNA